MITTLLSLVMALNAAVFYEFNETPGYQVYNYTLKDGLAFNNVNAIVQDSVGFIWIATEDGLSRFDGKHFRNFKYETSNPHSLAGNYIQDLFLDQEGVLWLTSRTGISKFNSRIESFEHYNILGGIKGHNKMDVGAIHSSLNRNILWVSANGMGVYKFNKNNGDFDRYTVDNLGGLRSNMVTHSFEDSSGLLWVGTQDQGLHVFRIHEKGLEYLDVYEKLMENNMHFTVHNIFEDSYHRILIATNKGLLIYDPITYAHLWIKGTTYGLPNDRFLSIKTDREGQVYLGLQDGGFYKLDFRKEENGKIDVLGFRGINCDEWLPKGITKRSVSALFFDRDQNLWAGSYGDGMFLLAKPKYAFVNYPKTKLLPSSGAKDMRFYGMAEDRHGNLFVGTDGHGLFMLDKQNHLLKHFKKGDKSGITDNAILVGFKDHLQQLWFGTYSGGLVLYDTEKHTFKNYINHSKAVGSLGANDVRVIYEDRKHQLWIGTNGGGLHKLNRSTDRFTQYAQHNSTIPSNDIRSITEDRKGNLIIGTYGAGITYFDQGKEQFTPYFAEKELYSRLNAEVIFDMKIRSDGKLLVATEANGLLVCDMEARRIIRSYHNKNSLVSNTIFSIVEDNAENCWLSTNKGLTQINKTTGNVHNYGSLTGLQPGIFNPKSAHYSALRNQLFFGGTGGLTYFDPLALETKESVGPIVFTGLEVFGKEVIIDGENEKAILNRPINDTKSIVLNPDQSTFTLHYASLDFGMSGENRFAYKLRGLEEEWNFVHDGQSATYHYLAPGNYTFEVAMEHAGVVITENLKHLQIKVLPPWYKTWWAYGLYLCLTCGLILIYQRYRRQQRELEYQLKWSQLEHEKDKELSTLKLNFYTRLSHEFRSTLTLILNPVKDLLQNSGVQQQMAPSLNTLYVNTNRLLRLSNQALTLRSNHEERLVEEDIDMVLLAKEVLNCFEHQAKQNGIDLVFQTETPGMMVYADLEKMEIILFNLIFNAIKFTEKGWIRVVLGQKEDLILSLDIEDSGCGIDKKLGDKLFDQFVHHEVQGQGQRRGLGFGVGLWMVKSFVEMHRGTITYRSEQGKGTCFHLEMPIRQYTKTSDPSMAHAIADEQSAVEQIFEPSYASIAQATKATGVRFSTMKMLVVDDDKEMTAFLQDIFTPSFDVIKAQEVNEALRVIDNVIPDIILCDVMMNHSNGMELCRFLKNDNHLKHIPIILLTAMQSLETQLSGFQSGADDYVMKPFDKEVLSAKVESLIKTRSNLKDYFYNSITQNLAYHKITPEEKQLLEKCVKLIESHMEDSDFNVHKLASLCRMTYATLTNHIKEVTGMTLNALIRFIRLQQAARLLLDSDATIYEVADKVGFRDLKYFREQFTKQYQMTPSSYIKKYRQPFHNIYHPN
ncbi:response regulator [Olivibacter sp. SDN3]|uniref:hybrid sensor histidine kinase/response regulator transcription factor n=1 Tax=Olivibacter sp. SDN3 TaxID=2764720 RepID=UPI00165171C7|nr:hybrid sensor histidine kinase/response regulator transcription factor [Olivibacter sp. SDN3]QNL47985.1 response regulator [Olivibacter sp. SDN3]